MPSHTAWSSRVGGIDDGGGMSPARDYDRTIVPSPNQGTGTGARRSSGSLFDSQGSAGAPERAASSVEAEMRQRLKEKDDELRRMKRELKQVRCTCTSDPFLIAAGHGVCPLLPACLRARDTARWRKTLTRCALGVYLHCGLLSAGVGPRLLRRR